MRGIERVAAETGVDRLIDDILPVARLGDGETECDRNERRNANRLDRDAHVPSFVRQPCRRRTRERATPAIARRRSDRRDSNFHATGFSGIAPTTLRRSTGRMLRVRRRSEEHTSELQSLMRNSYAVFCLKKKKLHIQQRID